MNRVTIIVTPRDRYSGVIECIEKLYRFSEEPFDLIVANLGYPEKLIDKVQQQLITRKHARIISLGCITPMQALAKIRTEVRTEFTVLLDNDTDVTPGWLGPLLETASDRHVGIVSPLVLEREGVDDGAELRNHLYQGEIRVVDYNGQQYLIENKLYRRALPAEIPATVTDTETFEMHAVLIRTQLLNEIDIPDMVTREHIDIALQAKIKGARLVTNPASVVHFDNLGTRMALSDMRYFFYRWSEKLSKESHALFESRWGYKFYSEQFMYNWAFRRKVFLVTRWLGFPIAGANLFSRIANKLFCKTWDPVPDVIDVSRHASITKRLGSSVYEGG